VAVVHGLLGGRDKQARFTLAGTDQRQVAPSTSARALLGPLPAGSFDLVVSAPGYAEAKERVEILAGQVVVREVTLAPARDGAEEVDREEHPHQTRHGAKLGEERHGQDARCASRVGRVSAPASSAGASPRR